MAATNVKVSLNKKIRTFEKLLRVFNKAVKNEGIIKEVRDRRYFESKSQKRRRRKYASKLRAQRKLKG